MKQEKAYEVWILGRTEDDESTEFEYLAMTAPYTDTGKELACELLSQTHCHNAEEVLGIKFPEDVAIIEIAVEAVKNFSATERSAFDVVATKTVEVK